MALSRKQHDSNADRAERTLAESLAPEDICRGDFVTLLYTVYEVPSYYWDDSLLPPQELVRLQMAPEDGGMPMKVCRLCLPYVLVKLPTGQKRAVDIRKCRLARLDGAYARATWRAYKRAQRREEARPAARSPRA